MANTWSARQWSNGTAGSWNTLSTTAGSYTTLQYGYGASYNQVIEIEFTAVDASYETIALRWQNFWGIYAPSGTENCTFRYKVSETSGDSSYINPNGSTSYDGTFAIGEGEYSSATITFTRSSGFIKGRTYYIYIFGSIYSTTANFCTVLWGKYDSTYYTGEKTSSFVEFSGGLIYIDNGSGWDAYEVYIDNGSSWDRYIPYIDNGSSWDLIG